MHELSIVKSIIELAENQVIEKGASSVESIELEIGQLSGVDLDALDFAWSCAVRNTVLQNAKRLINQVHGLARCQECRLEFNMHTYYTSCPNCESFFSEILRGKELRVKTLTVTYAAAI